MFIKKYPVFLFCFILVGLMLPRAGFAQGIELKDVLKIRLVERWGGASIAGNSFEIINKNGTWKSYRTKVVKGWDSRNKGPYQDSTVVFIKNISPKIIEELLYILANPDTGRVMAHYKLNNDSLKKYTDTIHPSLTTQQKDEFINALQNKNNIREALAKTIFILKGDNARYEISISTRTHKTHTASTWKDGFLSYLPWLYSGVYNYNPRIQDIFFELDGDTKAAAEETERFYVNIDKFVYRKYFETQFNWELFQAENPESYRILNNTVTPVDFVVLRPVPGHIPDFRESYILHSSRLPAYVNIYWNFSKTDTGNMRCFKRYEDTLAILFNQKSFLFDYMKNIKDGHLSVIKYSQGGMEEAKKIMYNNIKKYFASIEFYDPAHMHFFRVFGENGNLQHWIVFGDKAVVLADYTGELKDGDTTEFKGITPDPNAAGPHKNLKGLCLVFDATGKRLGGTTDRAFIGWPF